MCNFYSFVIFAWLFAAAAASPQRIVGGSLTTINQYPSIVALLRSSDLSFFEQRCGGTIINARAILTAAHCIERFAPPAVRVRVGSTFAHSGGVVHNSALFRLHPDYSPTTTSYDNDIAIILTSSVITFVDNAVQAALIAGVNYNPPDNASVWAAGWGHTSIWDWNGSEQLRHVEIWVVNLELCKERYALRGNTVTNNMLCSGYLDVGGRDQCSGDSGGPLYHNGVVVGVCSWGRLCADPRYPGVNTRVSSYTTWIQANA